MAKLMSPITVDKVTSTPISELRNNYKKLAETYLKIIDGDIVICPRCGDAQSSTGFYMDKRNKSGLFCYCKQCVKSMATDYNKKSDLYTDNKDKAKEVLKLMDRPYIDSLYNASVVNAQEKLGERIKSCGFPVYITQINSLSQYRDKKWSDSNFGIDDDEEVETKRITNTMIKRWGIGFSDSDYIIMDDHYKMLKNNNPNADSNQEIFIEDLCRTRLLMLKAMRGEGKSDDYVKYSKTYQDTFKQAGLKTVAEVDSSNEETLGVTLATISKYTPEEYYKDKTLYKDFDGLGDYISRFVFRPLKNLMFGSSERDSEYSVPETHDDIE